MTAFYDPDAALARVQQDIEAARERAEKAAAAQAAIAAVRGRGRSPRGDVTVEVDASGMLRDLALTDDAMRRSPRELEALILDAARAAQRDAGAKAVAVAEDAWGAGNPAVEHLRAEVEQRYTPGAEAR